MSTWAERATRREVTFTAVGRRAQLVDAAFSSLWRRIGTASRASWSWATDRPTHAAIAWLGVATIATLVSLPLRLWGGNEFGRALLLAIIGTIPMLISLAWWLRRDLSANRRGRPTMNG